MKSCVMTTRIGRHSSRAQSVDPTRRRAHGRLQRIVPLRNGGAESDRRSPVPPSRQSLLIVNADDYGHDRSATDLTIECFEHRRLSSATAMVYMEDSERAAALANEHDLPTGLHINFTEPF